MTLEEGHIYEFESFRFKNGAAAKRKFLTVLKTAEDGSLVGVLATSNDAGCREYLQGGDKGAVVSGNGVTVAWTIPPAEAVTSTGWRFTKPTFFYANQALYYSAHTIGGILDDSPRVIDRGALDPGVVEVVTRMVSQPEIGNQKSLLFLSGQMQTHLRRQMPRKVSDDLSMLGMSGAHKKALVENGIFLLEYAALPGGAALLVHDEGTVTAISADGSRRIGTTSDLLKLRNQNLAKAMKEKPSGQAAAEAAFSEPERPDRFPPGTLKPYVQAESAVEWLRRHLGGGTAFDRKSLYHLNIINSLIQHEKEIYKQIPSCRFSGLSEGGRRNVAASVILRAGKGPDREKYGDVRASGYTRSQELIGNWAERDGCWEDYAEKAQRDADVCRTWKVDKTAITYKVASSPETSCDFVGLDFNEIEEYAAGKGLNTAQPLPAGMKVVYIAFMPDSKITIKFSNGDSFVADYSNLQISGFTHPYLQYLSGSGTATLVGENLSFVIKANLNGVKKDAEATVYLILSKYVE